MIDNPNQTHRLMERLNASLPIAALMSPECLAMFRNDTGEGALLPLCRVTQIHYVGDEGGIVCGLDVDPDVGERVLYVSITHLRFDPRAALAREIASYQKHRIKRLHSAGRKLQA
jgi:hypothetical protein